MSAYARCFNENTRLRSMVFLTFLQNLHDTVGVVLKKDLNSQRAATKANAETNGNLGS